MLNNKLRINVKKTTNKIINGKKNKKTTYH